MLDSIHHMTFRLLKIAFCRRGVGGKPMPSKPGVAA